MGLGTGVGMRIGAGVGVVSASYRGTNSSFGQVVVTAIFKKASDSSSRRVGSSACTRSEY